MNPLAIILLLSGLFFLVFLLISFFLFRGKDASLGGGGHSARFFGGNQVGVVELNGVILDSRKILAKLERFEEDDQIKAVVLRLNSPGGSVAPSQEIYEAVKAYSKPLVVSMGSVAASGAYYIACGAKKVFANPGTLTGSIGVIMEFADLKKLYEWAKINRYSIKTGKFKDIGAEYREMTEEDRALLQMMVNTILAQFKGAVAAGRNLTPKEVTAIADGRVFSGSQAKLARLVDELGTLKDAVMDAARMAKISGKPKVVYPERKRRSLLDFLPDEEVTPDSAESWLARLFGVVLGDSKPGLGSLSPGVYLLWEPAR